MPRATWIPRALQDAGLTVTTHPGWDTRGSSDFAPRGVVCHHTASQPPADAPSLGICINGRPDLPGPLCHVLIGRDNTCHVIAAGRANHAGSGGWNGLTGNTAMLGIEVENNGVGEPWDDELITTFQRCAAALLRGAGQTTAANCCYHREWTSRKIDPAGPGIPQDGDVWREAVQDFIDNPGGGDDMTEEEHDMLVAIHQELKGVGAAFGKPARPSLRSLVDRAEPKLNRLLDHFGLKHDA